MVVFYENEEELNNNIQTLTEIAQITEEQALLAIKHYQYSLENAVNAALNGNLRFTLDRETGEERIERIGDDQDLDQDQEDDDDDDDDDFVMIDNSEQHLHSTNQQEQVDQNILPVRVMFGIFRLAITITGKIITKIVPANILTSLARAFRTHRLNQRYLSAASTNRARSTSTTTSDPIEAAKEFRRNFKEENAGSCLINFVELSHSDALQMAKSEYKLCFVYLHSPRHDDARDFCKDVLNFPEVARFVNEKFIAWGGDVSTSDALLLAVGISPSSFPYCALLSSLGSRVSLVVSVEGYCDSDELLEVLEKSIEDASVSMTEARTRNEVAETDRLLREEQDAAFKASLAADAAKEAERLLKISAEEELLKEIENRRVENERIENENKRKEEERELALKNRRAEKVKNLKPEPDSTITVGVTKIAFRMADGSRIERRFVTKETTLIDVFDFVDTIESVCETKYSLVSNFPRKVFHRTNETLVDVPELASSAAMLFIQSEEDE